MLLFEFFPLFVALVGVLPVATSVVAKVAEDGVRNASEAVFAGAIGVMLVTAIGALVVERRGTGVAMDGVNTSE